MTNDIVSSNIYDKRDDFNFEIVTPLPMVYIFLNLFVLLEYVLMLVTSTTETNFVCCVIKTMLSISYNSTTDTQI